MDTKCLIYLSQGLRAFVGATPPRHLQYRQRYKKLILRCHSRGLWGKGFFHLSADLREIVSRKYLCPITPAPLMPEKIVGDVAILFTVLSFSITKQYYAFNVIDRYFNWTN